MPARINLKRARKLAGFDSQRQLADQLGVNRVTVARWEAGEDDPSLAMALQVAKLLGRRVEQLFGSEPLFSAEELEAQHRARREVAEALALPGARR